MDDDILTQVQRAIKAPKDKKNEFGGYNYRNAESILRAFKDIQPEGVSLIMSDAITFIGERLFLVATAKLVAGHQVVAEAQGVAMHALAKKGMDDAQITGACSSYARKYALCGLFAIDDSADDPDSKDNRRATEEAAELAHARAVTDALTMIESASDMADLQAVWKSLKAPVQSDKAVSAAKEARKAQLSEAA